ncbi:ankyrin repeat domain-containing protein [Candidatus Dependentiae bacterium]|nr:ankyrin repeat domain-containing protein [Candidatus Dependentiae bacterium]
MNNYLSLIFACLVPFVSYSMKLEDRLKGAVSFNDLEEVKKLLAQKPAVNACSQDAPPALHYAVERGNVEIVRVLLDANADVNKQDTYGNVPLTGVGIYNPAILEIAPLFFKKNVSKTTVCNFGRSLLHAPCMGKIYDHTQALVHLLLTYGVSPNIQDAVGYSPLHFAVTSSSFPLVKELLEHNANPLLETKRGQNALDLARATCQQPLVTQAQLQEQEQKHIIMHLKKVIQNSKQRTLVRILEAKYKSSQPDSNIFKKVPTELIEHIARNVDLSDSFKE